MKEHLLEAARLVAPRLAWIATELKDNRVALTAVSGEHTVEGIFEHRTKNGLSWWRGVEGNPPELFLQIRQALNPADKDWHPARLVLIDEPPEAA